MFRIESKKNSSYSIDKSQITQEQLEVVTKFSFEETDSEIKFKYQMIDEVVSVGKNSYFDYKKESK